MKLNHVLVVNAIVTAFTGLGFLLAPAMQLATFGAQSTTITEMVARSYGASLLGWAIISWLGRHVEPSATRTGIVAGSIFFHLLGAGNLFYGMSADIINAMGWVPIVLDGLISAGLALTGFRRDINL